MQTGDPTSTGVTSEAGPEAHLVIWGTDVNVQETKKKFKDFLENFIDDLPGDEGETPSDRVEPFYMQRLEEVHCCLCVCLSVHSCMTVKLMLICTRGCCIILVFVHSDQIVGRPISECEL